MEELEKFREYMRVKPATFQSITDKIANHWIFQSKSNNMQMPVSRQLMILLYRVGHYGNAAGIRRIADWSGVSIGTVYNCFARVSIALTSSHAELIHWPDNVEKERAKEYVERESGCNAWRDGYVIVDGTTIPLHRKPSYHGEAFFGKDRVYGIALQVLLNFYFSYYLLTHLNMIACCHAT